MKLKLEIESLKQGKQDKPAEAIYPIMTNNTNVYITNTIKNTTNAFIPMVYSNVYYQTMTNMHFRTWGK